MVERFHAMIERGNGFRHRSEDWGAASWRSIAKIHKAHYIMFNVEINQKLMNSKAPSVLTMPSFVAWYST